MHEVHIHTHRQAGIHIYKINFPKEKGHDKTRSWVLLEFQHSGVGGSGPQSHLQSHSKFEVNLGYKKPDQKEKRNPVGLGGDTFILSTQESEANLWVFVVRLCLKKGVWGMQP